jgi:hypothetical protein
MLKLTNNETPKMLNIDQRKTIMNKEQGIMNKEVVQVHCGYFSAECYISTSKFGIPCSLFNIQRLFRRIIFFKRIILFCRFYTFNKD